MKTKDYKKERELLAKVDALKQIKRTVSEYDEYREAARKYVNAAWNGKMGEEAQQHVQDMVDVYGSLTGAIKEIARTLRFSKEVFKQTTEEKRNMRESTKVITAGIGEVMKDIVHENGLVEGDIHFPGFGTVRCSLKKEQVITNPQLLKESLVATKHWEMIKTEPLSKLKKLEDIDKIEGIEEVEIPKITISTER